MTDDTENAKWQLPEYTRFCRLRNNEGPAEPSEADLGRRLGPAAGRLLDFASFKKTLFRLHETHTFEGGPPKPIVSSTRNDHFQNSILTPQMDDPSLAGPTAPSPTACRKKRAFRLRQAPIF